MRPPFRPPAAAFSLLELLVVMAILAILLGVAAPAIISVLGGSNLNRAGHLVGDQIALARQEALTRNREVQVRFFKWADGPDAGWRGVQVWRIETSDRQFTEVPVSRLQKFPDGFVLSSQASLSPLLTADPEVAGAIPLSGGSGAATYAGFRFLPGGKTGESITATNNFVTVQAANDRTDPPKNFYTLQVHPLTGKVSVFRP